MEKLSCDALQGCLVDVAVVVDFDFEPDLDVAVVVDFELGLAAGELPHDARTKAAKSDAMIVPGNRLNPRIIDAASQLVAARSGHGCTLACKASTVNSRLDLAGPRLWR